jgi:hypothetical protein
MSMLRMLRVLASVAGDVIGASCLPIISHAIGGVDVNSDAVDKEVTARSDRKRCNIGIIFDSFTVHCCISKTRDSTEDHLRLPLRFTAGSGPTGFDSAVFLCNRGVSPSKFSL